MSQSSSQPSGGAAGPRIEPHPAPQGWRHSKEMVLAEMVVFAGIFIADWQGLIWFSKTLYLLPLAWISLRIRGLKWRDIGFARYQTWGRTVMVALLAALVISALELFVTGPLLTRLSGRSANLEDFRPLVGNVKLLAILLALNWPLAAFGEEFIFRGYLLNRLAGVGNYTPPAWAVSVVISSVAFGLAHTYQDITGAVEAGIDGALLALLYLRCDRKLAVPMIAHGVTNTIDFILIYLGRYPGM
ncbi:MAG: CPBP family intramembrane metalloprotease [Acidobacteriales bacterium]|nr:CPBP family intramembrane metalloprotease [Terriglobales bacterium]